MKRLIRPMLVLFGLAVVGIAAAQVDSDIPRPRPVAPETELEMAARNVRAAAARVQANAETLNRYKQWFDQAKPIIEGQRAKAIITSNGYKAAVRAWDTRVNPTCTHGLTYGACSCNPGRLGKARMKYYIKDCAEAARRQAAEYNRQAAIWDLNVRKHWRLRDEAIKDYDTWKRVQERFRNLQQGQSHMVPVPNKPGRDYLP